MAIGLLLTQKRHVVWSLWRFNMSYAIGHVIYGVPVAEKLSQKAKELGIYLGEGEDDDDPFGKGAGFELLYTGADYDAGFLGFECLEFDVCVDFQHLSQLEEAKKLVTPAVARAVEEKLRQFSYSYPELTKALTDEGVLMDFYIVWSYS